MTETNDNSSRAKNWADWKQALYGNYLGSLAKNRERRDRISEQAYRMALDLPADDETDDMQVTRTDTRVGITWKEIAAVGAIGLGAAGLYLLGARQADTSPPAITAPGDDENTQYTIGAGRPDRELKSEE